MVVYTYRQARNYSDPSTDRFIAVMRLIVKEGHKRSKSIVCEDIREPCSSGIIYMYFNNLKNTWDFENYNFTNAAAISEIKGIWFEYFEFKHVALITTVLFYLLHQLVVF